MTPEWIAEQDEDEKRLGHYEPGRFGWVLGNVRPLSQPVPAKGFQQIWNLLDDDAAEVLKRVAGA